MSLKGKIKKPSLIHKYKDVFNERAQMKGEWKKNAGKLKQQFADLTDDDLLFSEGKEEELLGRLQQKIGKTKEEIRLLIEKL